MEASKLTVASRELTNQHSRVLEIIFQVFSEDVFKCGQIEAILECRNEQDLRFGP